MMWLCLLLGVVGVHADIISGVQKLVTGTRGADFYRQYEDRYNESLMEGDTDLQVKRIYEWLDETRRQHDPEQEAFVLVTRASFYYNNDMNDSIFSLLPDDLDFLRNYKLWKEYDEVWAFLCNTYIYSGKANSGLHKVQEMFADAEQRKDDYGMGLAYTGMGNAYSVLGNSDESINAYQKALDIMVKMDRLPAVITEVYPNYADLLNDRKEYDRLERLTDQWRNFLQRFISEHHLEQDSYQVITYWSYYYLARAQAYLGKGELMMAAIELDAVKKTELSEDDYLGQKYLFYKAQLSYLQGNYDTALALNTRRMQQMEETDDRSALIQVRQQRAEILEKLGRFAEAAQLYRQMYVINDSINANDIKSQLSEMNTLFQVDELKMKQQREQFIYMVVIASVIVVALVIFLLFRMRAAKHLKIAHDKLEQAHDKLEQAHGELLTAYDNLEETTKAKERIESDLRIARDIQMSMVPHQFPDRPDLDIYASMTPAKEVGGDLYDFLLIGDRLYFALGDVSGKGVPASLFMAQATRLFHTLAKLQMKPAEIATRLNDELAADNDQGMFVTMFLGVADLTTGHLAFCNAGHNPPVLIGNKDGGTKSEECHFLEMIPNAPIGLWPGLEYEGEEIDNIAGEPLFIYTDGLNEAENRQQDQFTDERLLEILQTRPYESAQKTIEMLREEVEKHRDGAEPNDDLTMLCFRIDTHKQQKP